MRLLPRRRMSPLKLAVFGGAIFMAALVFLQKVPDTSFSAEPGLWEQVVNKDKMMILVREAAKNLGFQMPNPDLYENIPCPLGVYSRAELTPHLERPPQDPKAPGANGDGFKRNNLSPEETKEKEDGMTKHCFNQFASDRISLGRSLGDDTRPPECLAQKFFRCPPLPDTSVIIVFHNEAWSTLLRTVYSVLYTSPAILLKEIILVDDASTEEYLQGQLEEFVRELKIVRVMRQQERKGLVAARLLGTSVAQGQVLTFLDAHCECFHGWLEPLMSRIAEEPSAVVSPRITSIDFNTFSFKKPAAVQHYSNHGSFDWALTFIWENIPANILALRNNETHPIKTPTFAGGLFSISKSYFEHIGTYDDQMEIWGGENLEMSFRVWQCGGQLEILPCSVVGHVFRTKSPHTFPKGTDVIVRNQVRLAEVWLDDYKALFYHRNNKAGIMASEHKYGNVSDRVKLRENLHCKNFSWYLNTMYPELYVPDILPLQYGAIRNAGSKTCLDVGDRNAVGKPLIMYTCHNQGGNQYFEYTSNKELRHNINKQLCLQTAPDPEPVKLQPCALKQRDSNPSPHQQWVLAKENLVKNPISGKCLQLTDNVIVMAKCNAWNDYQRWSFT
ncbi:polypeptide N-acetylgalactosaminyltransferase 6 [Vanacampus margaritifer]